MSSLIKCFGTPKPNCRVRVDKTKDWEARAYNEENDYVYAYHRGYLWPQWTSGRYYRFELVALEGTDWQEFKSYQETPENIVTKQEGTKSDEN